MKNKVIICLLLVSVMMSLIINLNSFAITLPELMITSNNYSVGDKMILDEIIDIEIENTLQLYAVIAYVNDMMIDDADSLGVFIKETGLNDVIWSSSNTEIATVDNTGIVTGIEEGKATITAQYDGESANYEINVKPKSNSEDADLIIQTNSLIPQPALVLNNEYGFWIYLNDIPDSEKGNVKVSIDNENIAKITEIDLCNWEDGSGKGLIIANAKFLSLGQFTITATLNYNGNVYTDSYTNRVVESRYTLTLSAEEYTDLPSSIEVGDEIQLIATLGYVGAVLSEDVTTNGVVWTSSNKEVATVDKGLVSAKKEGKVTITAKYTEGDDTVTETYVINIKDPNKTPLNPGTTEESSNSVEVPSVDSDPTIAPNKIPNAGENTIIMIFCIIVIISIMIIGYRNYKDAK